MRRTWEASDVAAALQQYARVNGLCLDDVGVYYRHLYDASQPLEVRLILEVPPLEEEPDCQCRPGELCFCR